MANFANLAYGLVQVPPSPTTSGTTLTLQAGHGARFPVTPFKGTIWPVQAMPDPTNAEIVVVTAISGDLLTLTRAQEGTVARDIVLGDQIAATITKGYLDQVPLFTSDPVTWTGQHTFNGALTTENFAAHLNAGVIVTGPAALNGNVAITGELTPTLVKFASMLGYDEPWQTGTLASGVLPLDYRLGNHAIVQLTANVTGITIANVPAFGKVASLMVFYVGDGTVRTVTHTINGTPVRFPGAEVFTMTGGAGRVDRILYTTWSGGTSWLGDVIGLNY